MKENNYKYKLKSIIIHQGNANLRHYYAIIKDNNKNIWSKYDDKNIQYINITDIKNESYGNKGENFKDCDSYLLFYEKLNNNNCANFNIIKSVNIINKEHKNNINNERLNFSNLYEFDKLKVVV